MKIDEENEKSKGLFGSIQVTPLSNFLLGIISGSIASIIFVVYINSQPQVKRAKKINSASSAVAGGVSKKVEKKKTIDEEKTA